MTNGNRWVAIGLVVLAAGTGYLGFRLATRAGTDTYDGPLDIGAPPASTPRISGIGSSAGPIRVMTDGPESTERGETSAPKSRALTVFETDVEAQPVIGLVTNTDSVPVRDARVEARLMTARASRSLIGEVVATTSTDVRGQFSLSGFQRLGEQYVLDVTHPEYALVRTPSIDPLRPSTTMRDIVLGSGAHVAGTISNEGGTPLAGVEVTAYDLELVSLSVGGSEEGRATSDAQGRYEIKHLRGGRKRVVARAPGLANAEVSLLKVRASVETLDFKLAAGHILSGRVVDADTGAGIGDVLVRARPVGSSPTPSRGGSSVRRRPGGGFQTGETTKTAPDGSFRIAGLTRFQHVLSAVRGREEVGTINAMPGDEAVELRMRIQGAIAGRVIDAATGEPVTRFSVTVSRGPRPALVSAAATRRIADPDGAFTALDVAPGIHHVVVEAPGYATGMAGPVETGLGDRVGGVEVRLERGIVVHGRVVDDEGEPIAGAGVLIVEEVEVGASATHPGILPQRRIDAARSAGTTFADGSYLLANVGQGRFHLTVGKLPQHVSTDTESFTLIGGEGTIALSEVVLARAATVTGIVFDDAGRPDHAAVVTAFPQVRMSGGPPSPAGTDAQGHYRLEGLRPGTWRIAVTVARGRAKMDTRNGSGGRMVTLVPGGTASVDFRD